MSVIHVNNLHIVDGGSPVKYKSSTDSGTLSDDKDYYDGMDLSDMISGVLEPTRRSKQEKQQQHYEGEEEGQIVDITPGHAHASASEDECSLHSDDIYGGSDISDVEKQQRESQSKQNFVVPPLINDDESTVDMRPPAPVNQSVSSYVEALNRQQTRKNRIIKLGLCFVSLGLIAGVAFGIVSVTSNKNESEMSGMDGDDGGRSGLESNHLNAKEGFSGNVTTGSPSLSPVDFLPEGAPAPPMGVLDPSVSPTYVPGTTWSTSKSPTLHPHGATDAPVASPVTLEPTTEPTPSPTDEPTSETTPNPTPKPTNLITPPPTPNPTNLITPPPTPNPTRLPTPKPFLITFPPTPRPTPRPSVPSVTIPTSPTDITFHCAEVTYTANWNQLVKIDCDIPCSGLGMNSECPSGHQCRSDERSCIND